MKPSRIRLITALLLGLFAAMSVQAQQPASKYGAKADSIAQLVKMNYVYSFEEAIKKANKTKKPIFVNAFADWALPCHGMNQYVFNNEDFCKWADEHFVCLFLDVTKGQGRTFADRYKVSTFAHYLVLDAGGEIVHRIVGGATLPAFQNQLAAALNPATSLSGTRKAYENGDRSKATLLAYLSALKLAEEDSIFDVVSQEYIPMLNEQDLQQKDNWFIVSKKVNSGDEAMLARVMGNRETYVANVGGEEVEKLLSLAFGRKLMPYLGEQTYDAQALLDIYINMQKAELADTSYCYQLYDVIKAHGEHRYAETIELIGLFNDQQLVYACDLSLKFPDPTPAEQEMLKKYYTDRAAALPKNSSVRRAYEDLAANFTAGDGIQFSSGLLSDILAKAKREGKLVFVDCYTTWCGPCKMLSRTSFPKAVAGEYFNPRFVSVQIDMEKGEGPALAKKWGISSYPTMMVLTADGEVLGTIVGFRQAEQLVSDVKAIVEKN